MSETLAVSTPARPDDGIDLPSVNGHLEKATAEEMIQWAQRTFNDGLVMSSSFGADSAVLLHLASQIHPGIKVIFVNTGYLFPETHAFMESLRRRLNLNVWTYRTRSDPIAYLKEAGEGDPTWRQDITRCCGVNKNEPFDRAMRDLAPKAWLRGVRRGQADTRKMMQPVEWSNRYNCYAVSPLINWHAREVYAYLKQHDLPHHPLVEHGYLSIGCNPLSCTRPVSADEDPRAGRWSGTAKLECGINTNESLDSSKL